MGYILGLIFKGMSYKENRSKFCYSHMKEDMNITE